MMTDDIDTFIRNQKDKLRIERQTLAPQAAVDPSGFRAQRLAAPAARPGPVVRPLDDLADSIVAPLPRSQPPKQPLPAARHDDPPRPLRPEEEEAEKPLVSRLGQYEERRRKFNAQRQQEYQRLQADEEQASRRRREGDLAANGRPPFLPGTKSDSAKVRAKVEERNKEYQEFKALEEAKFQQRFAHMKPPQQQQQQQQQQQPAKWAQPTPRAKTPPPRREVPPERPYEDGPVFGEREKWEELLQGPRRPAAAATTTTALERHGSETRLNELERAVRELRGGAQPLERAAEERQRTRRWSQTQLEPHPHPLPLPPPDDEAGGFLELPERRSGIRRREEERNHEYNELLRQMAAKDDAKRASRFRDDSPRRDDNLTEQRYLHAMMDGRGDAPRRGPPVAAPAAAAPLKAGGTGRFHSDLMKLDSLDSLYNNVRANLVRRHEGHKTDDEWLSPRTAKDLDKGLPPRAPGRRQGGGGRRGGGDDEEAGLGFGRNASESAQKRRKDQYRQELEQQMEEAKQRALREKEEARSALPEAPLTRSRSHTELSRPGLGANLTPTRSTGGLDTLLGSDGAQSGLGPYQTPADDVYNFYASKNPFESNGYAEDLLGELGAKSAGKNVRFDTGTPRAGATPGLLGPEERSGERKAQQQKQYANVLQQQMEEKKKQKERAKADQEAYDKKFEQEASFFSAFGRGGGGAPVKDAEGNVRADLRNYLADGGPSAGRKSATGPSQPQPQPQSGYRSAFESSPYDDSPPRLNLSGTLGSSGGGGGGGGDLGRSSRLGGATPRSARPQTNALGEVTHARGGHGILGQPLTDEQKESRSKLRSYLDMQIEEKRQMREREREEQRREEEKEMKRIEEERRKMQQEEEEDRRRRAEKEEEAKRKNEEAMRRQEEERRRYQKERSPRPARQATPETSHQPDPRYERSSSPPVPAVLLALKKEGKASPRSPRTPRGSGREPPPSPSRGPVAAPASPRARPPPPQEDLGSSFALRDLRRIKQQLHSERERVERALLQQHYSVDVSDPRLSARRAQPPQRAVPVAQRAAIDPFEAAFEKQRPVPVRRQPPSRAEGPSDSELKEFKALKGSDLPGTPLTSAELELQQERYLREQEDRLRRLQMNQRSGSSFAADMPGMAPQDLGLVPRGTSPDDATQLQADTAFIGINGAPFQSSENPFSLPVESLVPSARSQVDADALARKNAERFRRLQQMEQENNFASNADDYEEVLARFLEKQGQGRSSSRALSGSRPPRAPSSGQALPFNVSRTGRGLGPLAEHESALESPLQPDPVSHGFAADRSGRDAQDDDLDWPSGPYPTSPPAREYLASS